MSKAAATREFIIEKTAPVFNKKGYAGTSLTDLTEATGLTKGSIYGNFSGKDEVALAVFDYNLKKMEAVIASELAKKQSAKEKLMLYATVYGNALKFPIVAGGCPILNTATEADDTHSQLRDKAKAALLGWKNKLVKLLEKGKADKEFSKNFDAEQVAFTMIAIIEGAIMIASLTGKASHMPYILQSVKKLIKDLA
ncbi:MAG: TetR/AcrR family transcriptional regulator [Chitinophagaceae bacterium]